MNQQQTIGIEWLAGFYEGDGTPLIANYSFGLSISQCNQDIIEKIAMSFGGSAKPSNSSVADEWRWRIHGKRAAKLALELLEHMYHPRKTEQLTKALILTTHLPPRTTDETKEVETYREKARTYQRKQHNDYYHKKRDEVRTSHQRNHAEHREARRTKMKEWHDEHRVEISEYNKHYYEKQKLYTETLKLLRETQVVGSGT